MTDVISRHVIITGRVQGVGFRAFVCRHANALGLDGFVRNRADGTVEAVVSGEPVKVEALLGQCRLGPPGSRVENIQANETAQGIQAGFLHLPSL